MDGKKIEPGMDKNDIHPQLVGESLQLSKHLYVRQEDIAEGMDMSNEQSILETVWSLFIYNCFNLYSRLGQIGSRMSGNLGGTNGGLLKVMSISELMALAKNTDSIAVSLENIENLASSNERGSVVECGAPAPLWHYCPHRRQDPSTGRAVVESGHPEDAHRQKTDVTNVAPRLEAGFPVVPVAARDPESVIGDDPGIPTRILNDGMMSRPFHRTTLSEDSLPLW